MFHPLHGASTNISPVRTATVSSVPRWGIIHRLVLPRAPRKCVQYKYIGGSPPCFFPLPAEPALPVQTPERPSQPPPLLPGLAPRLGLPPFEGRRERQRRLSGSAMEWKRPGAFQLLILCEWACIRLCVCPWCAQVHNNRFKRPGLFHGPLHATKTKKRLVT